MAEISRGLMTQKQLAQVLDTWERTLERWRVEGVGPAFVKAGRRVLYRSEDLDDWLMASRRRSTSDGVGR